MAGAQKMLFGAQSRLVLWAGFGGLLLLMAFGGIDSIRQLRQIQSRTEEVQREYADRDRLLHEIRSDLYVSGTYVRDYLLRPEPPMARSHLPHPPRVARST